MLGRSENPSSDLRTWVIAAGADQGFGARVREVWQYRRILGFFSIKAVQSLYAKTHLGVSWIFIRTLVPLAVGSFVFGSVMQIPSGGVPYLLFFLIGQVAVELLRRSADPRKPRHRGQQAAADQTLRASHHPAARTDDSRHDRAGHHPAHPARCPRVLPGERGRVVRATAGRGFWPVCCP